MSIPVAGAHKRGHVRTEVMPMDAGGADGPNRDLAPTAATVDYRRPDDPSRVAVPGLHGQAAPRDVAFLVHRRLRVMASLLALFMAGYVGLSAASLAGGGVGSLGVT